MTIFRLLLIGFLLSACANISPKQANNSNSKESNNTQAMQTSTANKQSQQGLVGNYILIEGDNTFSEGVNGYSKSYTKGKLNINQINEQDYGYRYTVQLEGKKHPEGFYGVIYKKGDKFYQKVLDQNSSILEVRDNFRLEQEDDKLTLFFGKLNGHKLLIWKRSQEENKTMCKEYKEAFHDYKQLYEDNFDQFTVRDIH